MYICVHVPIDVGVNECTCIYNSTCRCGFHACVCACVCVCMGPTVKHFLQRVLTFKKLNDRCLRGMLIVNQLGECRSGGWWPQQEGGEKIPC